jgi:integrase/recombinase XerC/integrase/recombinase XerD
MTVPASFFASDQARDAVLKYLYFMSFIKSASAQTLRSYRVDLSQAFGFTIKELEQFIPGRPITFNSSEILATCRAAQSQWATLSPASRNRKAACLKSFLNWLHDEGAIDQDLSHQIHAPRVPLRLPHFLSVDETLALISSLRSDLENAPTAEAESAAKRDLALILLLYGGGLRVSEACSLEWARIDRSGRILRVLGKGGKERIVALPPIVIAALERLASAGNRAKFVFGELPLNTRVAYEIVRTRGAKAGLLQPLHPHALRHSYATHLLASGANLRTLQELLGHSTLQATQRYTHVGVDQLARTLEALHPLGTGGGAGRKTRR